jgi:hypothetical protein
MIRWLLVLLLTTLPALADQQPDARPVTWVRCSSTITVGGTAQNLSLGTGPLRGFFLQNPSTALESLYYDPATTATTTASAELTAGQSVSFGPGTIFAGNVLSIIAGTGGHNFRCFYAQ